MIDDKKRKQVYEVLIMPIKCEKHCGFDDNREVIICKKDDIVISTETYWPEYRDKDTGKPHRYPFTADCDMSDFACGFYEIIYAPLLNDKKIVDEVGNFVNKEFAGDTMTSVSQLRGLEKEYHCLANFWVLPMELGRKSENKLSKTSNYYDIKDFMDRFLLLLRYKFDDYKNTFPEYFKKIDDFKTFSDIHMLSESYLDENNMVLQYSDVVDKFTENYLSKKIKKRAEKISESNYASDLWDYFNKYKLFE